MKKWMIFLSAILIVFLYGCAVEKRLTVANIEPEEAFIQCQSIMKDKIPAAKLTVDTDQRKLKIVDTRNFDYPTAIELKFSKESSNTIIVVKASGEKQRLENLYYILSQGLQPKSAPLTIPSAPITRPGHAVISPDDLQMDVNKDGWVTPQEENLYRQQVQLSKQRELLQAEQ